MDDTLERSIVEWDEDDVARWLSQLGYSQYESQIKGTFVALLATLALTAPQNTEYLAIYSA